MQYRLDPHATTIEPAEAASLGQEVVLVDVRATGDFEAGHVPASINVSLDTIEAGWCGKNGRLPFVTIDRTGDNAERAAEFLRDHGRDAVAIQGGLLAWTAAGLALVTNTGAPARVNA